MNTLILAHAEDPTLQRAIAFLHGCIKLQTYDTVRDDPGVRAWFQEHWEQLCVISHTRRRAYDQANAG